MDSVEAFLENHTELAPRINSLGIAIAGWLDPVKGFIYYSPNMKDFRDVPLGDALREHFPYEVFVDNDTTSATWGEYLFGIVPKPNSLLGVFLGTGVGGGLVLNGKPWRGPNGSAGEIGHTTVEPDGGKCLCGSDGCLEIYVGAQGIVRAYEALVEQSSGIIPPGVEITPKYIHEAGKSGDPNALAAYSQVGRYLGVALSTVVDLLSIDACVIGGKISAAADLFWESMMAAYKKNILDPPNGACLIHRSRLVDKSGVLGAAFLPESFYANSVR
jgi:predicted NBD/HSP70 family sugar kinase